MQKPDLPDLDAMSFDELWAMHEELTKILSERLLGEKRELEKRLAQLIPADAPGVEDRRGRSEKRPSRRKYPQVLPKYINPLVPSETWSGRGKRPRWLTLALKQGHRLDDFEVKDSDADQSRKNQEEDPPREG